MVDTYRVIQLGSRREYSSTGKAKYLARLLSGFLTSCTGVCPLALADIFVHFPCNEPQCFT